MYTSLDKFKLLISEDSRVVKKLTGLAKLSTLIPSEFFQVLPFKILYIFL